MTSLIEKIGKLIKREKTTPERKKKDDSTKSSSEILSELFSAFNADPPKIEEVSVKKTKKSKKKHKKEKKKRSRSSSSSSNSDNTDTHKRKKRKKSKSKKRKQSDRERSPSCSPPRTPISLTPERLTPELLTPVRPLINCEGFKEKPLIIKKEIKEIKHEPVKVKDEKVVKNEEIKRISGEVKKNTDSNFIESKEEIKIKFEPQYDECDTSTKSENLCFDTYIEASEIPMPESPIVHMSVEDTIRSDLHETDLRFKLENKRTEADNDKTKGRIQIKNLKFSTVFEETLKKVEEERRKKAEKYEDGECTGSSSSSDKEEESNSQFPKSSDPGGILKRQAAEEKVLEEDRNKSKKSKHSETSHKSSKRDNSKSRKRSRSRSKRSRSRSKKRRHRSRSKSRRSRHRSSSAKSHRSRHRSSSRSKRRSRSKSRSHRSRHHGRRSRSPSGVKLADHEKKRLLEVARRNAINMLKNGAVPAGAAALPPHTRNQVMAAIQSGGKSVDELTDFCKHLSKKEALGELSSVSSNDENDENEDTIAFHHPFLVKEKAPIVMNIRGGAPLPVKTNPVPIANKEELRLQFPVSSGSQHREKALEWVPVSPKKDSNNMQVAILNSKDDSDPDITTEKEPEKTTSNGPLALPAPPSPTSQPSYLKNFSSGSQLSSVPALPAPGPQAYPPGADSDSPDADMSSLVSLNIARIRREQEENELSDTHGFGWSKDNTLGQFTGTTGAQILTPKELASGTQAWAKKDQLTRAAPVEGGMGMHLLQKMGWTPGQGLGKEGTGTLQPLLLEVKLDTKGLQAKEEVNNSNRHHNKGGMRQHRQGRRGPAPLVAGGKHPVSLLGEYCSKQKLGPPEYSLCFECGPDHKKNFLFKVKVAGVEYQPAVASANKKQAKADAAQLALQKIGIVS